ncbi:MAG: hypothetical protein ACTHMA_18555 [Thermomicrobiales bacterium]
MVKHRWMGHQHWGARCGRETNQPEYALRGRTRGWWALLCAVGLFALLAAFLPPPAVRAAGAPTLTLDPPGVRCDTINPLLTVRGAGFPAGITVELIDIPTWHNSQEIGLRIGSTIVEANGTFVVTGQLGGCAPSIPRGVQFIIGAFDTSQTDRHLVNALATTTFTVSYIPPPVAPGEKQCFAETGHCIAGHFLAFWRFWGGLPRFGYPLTDEYTATLEDGNAYTVQYFERDRMEYHPENQPPYDILLGQFGRQIYATLGR